jgi:hypothetical protein
MIHMIILQVVVMTTIATVIQITRILRMMIVATTVLAGANRPI